MTGMLFIVLIQPSLLETTNKNINNVMVKTGTLRNNQRNIGNGKGKPMGITMATPTLTLEGNTLPTQGYK
jgi:hypothetical protein